MLIHESSTETIRQMPQNYLVAHRSNGSWKSEPDLAADMALCTKVYRTINHSHANKYIATGQQIIDMALKLQGGEMSQLYTIRAAARAIRELDRVCFIRRTINDDKYWTTARNCLFAIIETAGYELDCNSYRPKRVNSGYPDYRPVRDED